jgi:hypothetical protein
MDESSSRAGDSRNTFDRVLAKYVTIWVWSILVGINTTVTFSFIGSGLRARGPSALTFLGPVYLAGAICTMVAWYYVVRYLRYFIVPNFFWTSTGELEQDPRAWGSIRTIGIFLFLSIFFRMLLALFDFAFSSTWG